MILILTKRTEDTTMGRGLYSDEERNEAIFFHISTKETVSDDADDPFMLTDCSL